MEGPSLQPERFVDRCLDLVGPVEVGAETRTALLRHAGIAVDADGDIYVADWGNDRVQQFDSTGRYLDKFIGDATLGTAARTYVLANPKPLRLREMTSLEPAKRLRGPSSVRLDGQGRMYITDYGSHRIQVYKKEAYPLEPDQISPSTRTPILYTV